jgi:hypothetical protein
MQNIRPFATTQCHHCQHVRYIHTKTQQVYLMCQAHRERYLPQPQFNCDLYTQANLVRVRITSIDLNFVWLHGAPDNYIIQFNRKLDKHGALFNLLKSDGSLYESPPAHNPINRKNKPLMRKISHKATSFAFYLYDTNLLYWSETKQKDYPIVAYLLPLCDKQTLKQASSILLALKANHQVQIDPVLSLRTKNLHGIS